MFDISPGLGQVYNGQAGKGFAVFLLTLMGLVMLVIPGLIVWLYGMYDAYSVAGKMNTGRAAVPRDPDASRGPVYCIRSDCYRYRTYHNHRNSDGNSDAPAGPGQYW